MTMYKPTLFVRRLSVYKDSKIVFDAHFHSGVNIIHGHNSSGKTTILDFIAYTLGAENIPWKQEALLCDWSLAEVQINGKSITLGRAVNDKPMNPLYIYWGSYSDALANSPTSWEVYGFRRSEKRLSFTQALLLAMELPEAQGDGASNITMHQILRVLYADQPSLHSPIFRSDTFDSALIRETIGSYLTGVYDDALYSAQLEKRSLEKEEQQLDAELKSIYRVLARSEQNADFEFIGQEISHLERERESAIAELARLRRERTIPKDNKKKNNEEKIRNQLDAAKKEVSITRDGISRYELEIADSESFIREIEIRLQSLDESRTTRGYFGKASFAFCPCCLAEVKGGSSNSTECSLCKTALDTANADAQLLRMRNELRIQLTESASLITERRSELERLKAALPQLQKNLKTLELSYAESSQTWSSELESAMELSAKRVGALEQEIKGLYESQRLAETIRLLREKRDEIGVRLLKIESQIESLLYTQEERKKVVQFEVASTLRRLLHEDLNRQAEFNRAESVQFSFVDNTVSVEGSSQFSESSTVVLRHLFHLALLSASTRIAEMRFPRFLMLDGIEDGGMELERSYRLQEIIVNECSKFDCEYQLIFATSQISPLLNDEKYIVSQPFSETNRSLRIN